MSEGQLDTTSVAAATVQEGTAEAERLITLKAWSEAEQAWRSIREAAPDSTVAYERGAHVALQIGNVAEAERLVLRAVDLLIHRQAWREAAELMGRFVPAFPTSAETQERWGHALIQAGDFTGAEATLGAAVQMFPEHVGLRQHHAEVAMSCEHWADAAERWAALRALEPDHLAAYSRGGLAALRLDQLDDAEIILAEALRREVPDLWPWIHFGEVALRRGDTNSAFLRFDEARRRFPNEPAPSERAGFAMLQGKRLDEGEAILSETVVRFPYYIWGRLQHAEAASLAKRWDVAAERWRVFREMFPQQQAGWFRGGIALMNAGALDEAENVIEEGVQRFPVVYGLQLRLDVALRKRDFAGATERWLQAFHAGERGEPFFNTGAKAFGSLLTANGARDLVDRVWDALLAQPSPRSPSYLPALVFETMRLWSFDPTAFKVVKGYADTRAGDVPAGQDEDTSTLVRLCLELIPDGEALEAALRQIVLASAFPRQCVILDARLVTNCARMRAIVKALDEAKADLTAEQTFNLSVFATTFDNALADRLIARFIDGRVGLAPLSTPPGVLAQAHAQRQGNIARAQKRMEAACSRKLRVALCVSGQLRGYQAALATWPLFSLAEQEVDTFVHTWDDIGRKFPTANHAERVFSGAFLDAYRSVFRDASEADIARAYPSLFEWFRASERVTAYDLSRIYRTEYVVVEDDKAPQFAAFSNSEKMYWKVQECFRLVEQTGREYDLVIRIRPDKPVRNARAINWHSLLAQVSESRTILVDLAPYLHCSVRYVIGDQFGVGDYKAMAIYSTTYERTKRAMAEKPYAFPVQWVPHENFAFTCFHNGIRVEAMREVAFGTPLDPGGLATAEVLALLRRDIGPAPRNAEDRALLMALEHDLVQG